MRRWLSLIWLQLMPLDWRRRRLRRHMDAVRDQLNNDPEFDRLVREFHERRQR